MKTKFLKSIDVTVWILLTIGGLNWGLIGFFDFNLVAAIFGPMTIAARVVYALVGIAAVYEILGAKVIAERWNLHYRTAPTS